MKACVYIVVFYLFIVSISCFLLPEFKKRTVDRELTVLDAFADVTPRTKSETIDGLGKSDCTRSTVS